MVSVKFKLIKSINILFFSIFKKRIGRIMNEMLSVDLFCNSAETEDEVCKF